MLRLTAITLFSTALLFGCSDDASGPHDEGSPSSGNNGGSGGGGNGGPSKNASAWAGRWYGTVDCEGVYEDSNGKQPYSGPVPIEAAFDDNGHMLYPAGNQLVPQTHQGQLDQWVPDGGGVAKRLLARFQDNGDQRYYLFEEVFDQTEQNGSFHRTTNEEYDLRVEGQTMRGTYNLEVYSRTMFSADVGSGISESREVATCQGELKRQ